MSDDEQSYSIHQQDLEPATEGRNVEEVAAELADDSDPQHVVAPGAGAHERGAGTRSPGGGDDAIAGDENPA
jgi:hypothetical protein